MHKTLLECVEGGGEGGGECEVGSYDEEHEWKAK